MSKRSGRKKKDLFSKPRFSSHDPSVPILVNAHEVIGTTDRALIGNAFLSRLEHFGIRQDRSEETDRVRATKVDPDNPDSVTIGFAIDRYVATICDVIVDAFQALPPATWGHVAVEIGLLSPCVARRATDRLTRVRPRKKGVRIHIRAAVSCPVEQSAEERSPHAATASEAETALRDVAEILKVYDTMSMRACNVIRSFLKLPPVALGQEKDVRSPMSRRRRRALAKIYEMAEEKMSRTFDFVDASVVDLDRKRRQDARGRTIRIFGFDSGIPTS